MYVYDPLLICGCVNNGADITARCLCYLSLIVLALSVLVYSPTLL